MPMRRVRWPYLKKKLEEELGVKAREALEKLLLQKIECIPGGKVKRHWLEIVEFESDGRGTL